MGTSDGGIIVALPKIISSNIKMSNFYFKNDKRLGSILLFPVEWYQYGKQNLGRELSLGWFREVLFSDSVIIKCLLYGGGGKRKKGHPHEPYVWWRWKEYGNSTMCWVLWWRCAWMIIRALGKVWTTWEECWRELSLEGHSKCVKTTQQAKGREGWLVSFQA